MQHSQDKEFDQLFKDKFEAAEVQPSADLWNNIAGRLKSGHRPKLPVYWLAAATVLVVIGIGLIMPKAEKIRLHGRAELRAESIAAVVSEPLAATTVESSALVSNHQSTPLIIAPRLEPETNNKTALKVLHANKVNDRPVRAVPAESIEQSAQSLKEPGPALNSEPVLARVVEEDVQDDIAPTEKPTHNTGIRNVGDVINFVVNKIDRREKKIIQFGTDDDNSSVVSLNIGFIKFNRKSDK